MEGNRIAATDDARLPETARTLCYAVGHQAAAEAFGFYPSYDDSGMFPVREVDEKDDAQAKEFLEVPVPRDQPVSARPPSDERPIGDIFLRMPKDFRIFLGAWRLSLKDVGNDYTRYTVPRLVRYTCSAGEIWSRSCEATLRRMGDRPFVL